MSTVARALPSEHLPSHDNCHCAIKSMASIVIALRQQPRDDGLNDVRSRAAYSESARSRG
eukprot:42960-Prymnesium_polylepis.2